MIDIYIHLSESIAKRIWLLKVSTYNVVTRTIPFVSHTCMITCKVMYSQNSSLYARLFVIDTMIYIYVKLKSLYSTWGSFGQNEKNRGSADKFNESNDITFLVISLLC